MLDRTEELGGGATKLLDCTEELGSGASELLGCTDDCLDTGLFEEEFGKLTKPLVSGADEEEYGLDADELLEPSEELLAAGIETLVL